MSLPRQSLMPACHALVSIGVEALRQVKREVKMDVTGQLARGAPSHASEPFRSS